METFTLTLRGCDLAFLKEEQETTGITILSEVEVDYQLFKVTAMTDDLGYLFMAGELKGMRDAWAAANVKMTEMQERLAKRIDDLATKLGMPSQKQQ